MKIYFAASIRGGRDRAQMYPAIVRTIESLGHEVLSGMFTNADIDENEGTDPDKSSEYIYRRDIDWIREADAIVAEVTQPSLGVGYEIAMAENLNKKVICLYWNGAGKKLSAMIDGSSGSTTIYYDQVDELEPQLGRLLKF